MLIVGTAFCALAAGLAWATTATQSGAGASHRQERVR